MPFQKGHKINVGKTYSKGHRKNISEALTGRKLSKEHAKKNTGHGFQKGSKVNLGKQNALGTKRTEKQKEKQRKALNKHHIWYEDNEGNPTEKGVWLISNRRHAQIHQLLRKNHWTDNRRYLAG